MSWLLAAVGLTSLYIGGRGYRWGWLIGLVGQVLWGVYALQSKQYAFLFTAFAYAYVYYRNATRTRYVSKV